MPPTERFAGGLRCGQVLEQLSAFVDDELAPEARAQIVAHLQECDWCARFGGSFTALVASLREQLREAPSPDAGVSVRLRATIDRELDRR